MNSNYITIWKIYLASWFQQWEVQKKEIETYSLQFERIPLQANLIWNVVNYNVFMMVLLHFANFSIQFQKFALQWAVFPSILSSLIFYHYKYGSYFWKTGGGLSWASLNSWLNNWYLMQAMTLVGVTQTAILYVLGLVIEKCLLPQSWQWSFQFPLSAQEDSIRHITFCFLGFMVILILTLPLWKHGYNISMKAVGRDKSKITNVETLLELIYQSTQASLNTYTLAAIAVILENRDIRVHIIHVIFATLEALLANRSAKCKFCIMHQLMHEIQPLYLMAHVEHHICKSIHPTNLGAGLWERWAMGNQFIAVPFLNSIPYMTFQLGYCGANLVVHTMWPSTNWIQYHTLHHTILSDIYSANIPSPYDWENSKTLKEYGAVLKDTSHFMKDESLSDKVGLACILLTGFVMHHFFNIGVFSLDMDAVQWYPSFAS